MSVKAKKTRYSIRDHLTAYLVLFVILGVILLGAFVLYMSGLFDPVEVGPALADTYPLELPTPPPLDKPPAQTEEETGEAEAGEDQGGTIGLLEWLFPVASAEGAQPAQGENPGIEDLEALLEGIVGQEAQDDDPEIPAEEHVTLAKDDLAINPNLPDTVYNLLLLATDSRDVAANRGRSDVMIIASVNKTTNEVKLSSLSRDLYVKIPNGVNSDKLNTAYAYGGAQLAMKTVNELFEMNIREYALVDFSAMTAIVDAIGGIDIYLEPEEYLYINENVAVSEDYEGFAKSASRRRLTEADQDTVVHLDGLQAVSYARIRKLDNDLNRGNRQRILLQAIMDQAMRNLSPATFYSLATSLMSSVDTNVTLIQVMDIGKWVLEADEITLTEMSIPVADTWHYSREANRGHDMEVIVFQQPQNVQALHAFIYGEYIPAAEVK